MFRDFSNFEVEDFAFDESFQKWVTDRHAEHSAFWQQYINEHPHQIDKILAARELVLQLSRAASQKETQKDLADAIWVTIGKHISARPRRFSWMRAAAAVGLLLMASPLFFRFDLSPGTKSPQAYMTGGVPDGEFFIERVNKEDKVLEITLSDGSRISLEKNCRLRYPKHFGTKERVVHLDGEAFFDIEKDPKHPFIIFASKTVVKVLGTSFRVKARDNSEKVIVSVRSGKVSVFERKDFENTKGNPQMPGLVLMANQQAEFSNELEKFSKMIVADPLILGNTDKKEFDFDQTPLPVVFQTLEKAYGIEIIYDKDLVADRRLKVSLEDETLIEKLDVVCQTMGLSYHIVDARIIIETQ